MGYGGYAPGANSRMKDALTPLQQAFRELPLEQAAETLAIIDKLTRNVVRNPGEAKFRKINLDNDKIKKVITDVPNAVALLQEMGWVRDGASMELPTSTRLVLEVHVVGIIDAQEFYKTKAEKERVSQMRAAKEVDAESAQLRAQIEADRREKSAEGPVTQSSKAQKLGGGPNIARCSDVGIGQGG